MDDLYVLANTKMIAVLVEAGMISNFDEERLLSSEPYQKVISEAVAESIRSFCCTSGVSTYSVFDVASDDVLNIRSGPSANDSVIGTIPLNGRDVRAVGVCAQSWCPIDYNGVRGWINGRFLLCNY
jgi:uncharacterized protein YraI